MSLDFESDSRSKITLVLPSVVRNSACAVKHCGESVVYNRKYCTVSRNNHVSGDAYNWRHSNEMFGYKPMRRLVVVSLILNCMFVLLGTVAAFLPA